MNLAALAAQERRQDWQRGSAVIAALLVITAIGVWPDAFLALLGLLITLAVLAAFWRPIMLILSLHLLFC